MPEKDPQYLYCVHHDREPEVCGDSPLFPFWSDGKEPLICYNHMKRFNEEARRAPAEGEP